MRRLTAPHPQILSHTPRIGAAWEESAWIQHTRREVGTLPSCFWLLKLHYVFQCKKYPEGGEECLVHHARASSFVGFFSLRGKSLMIILFLICPSSISFSIHQVLLFFLFLLPPSVRFW